MKPLARFWSCARFKKQFAKDQPKALVLCHLVSLLTCALNLRHEYAGSPGPKSGEALQRSGGP